VSRTIAIVGGTGPEGSGLALRWARSGETIVIGSRDAARAAACAEEIIRRAGTPAQVRGAENAAAVAEAEIVVVTVPFVGHAATLKKLKRSFRPGAILIDTVVPLAAGVGDLATRVVLPWQGSAAEQAAELAPKELAVAAALHNISSELLQGDGPVDCDVIVCADDERAREAAAELAEHIPGVRAVNGGRLESARFVEQITALLIAINSRYKIHTAGLRITGLPDRPGR
jgi:8-hydroxy-5-deazaflavin:NADPH oxidoreductase